MFVRKTKRRKKVEKLEVPGRMVNLKKIPFEHKRGEKSRGRLAIAGGGMDLKGWGMKRSLIAGNGLGE